MDYRIIWYHVSLGCTCCWWGHTVVRFFCQQCKYFSPAVGVVVIITWSILMIIFWVVSLLTGHQKYPECLLINSHVLRCHPQAEKRNDMAYQPPPIVCLLWHFSYCHVLNSFISYFQAHRLLFLQLVVTTVLCLQKTTTWVRLVFLPRLQLLALLLEKPGPLWTTHQVHMIRMLSGLRWEHIVWNNCLERGTATMEIVP